MIWKKIIYALVYTLGISSVSSQCIQFCNDNIGTYSSDDPKTIAYDNMGSGFHSTFASENGKYSIWGELMNNAGTGHLLTPLSIDATNYPNLTGTIYSVGIGSNSVNTVQMIVLTSTGLFSSGVNGVVLSTAIKSTTAFQSVTVNGKTDGLPTGIVPDSIRMLFVTHRTIILTTCGGYVYVLSQDSNVRGDLGAGSSSAWSQVLESAGKPLSNVVATRGNGLFAFALKADSTIWTWGDSVLLGNGTRAINSNYARQMTKPAGIPGIKMIQATRNVYNNVNGSNNPNDMSYYLLGTDNKVYCLGANNNGQLGDNTTTARWVWVNALHPGGTTITDAKWISANEHDPQFPGLGVIRSTGQAYTCGNNNGTMIGRTVVGGTNNLNYPTGIAASDYIVFVEVGGHTSAFIKLNTSTYGYVGHHINGSIGNGSASASTISSVDFSIPPVINICGTSCDTPRIYHKPYFCFDTQAFFVIKSKSGSQIKYSLNGSPVDSVTIDNTDSAIIRVSKPLVQPILKITQVNNIFCSLTLNISDTIKFKYTKDSSLTICRNSPILFKGISLNTSGIYRDTFKNALLCDSFLILRLTVKDTSAKILFDTVCKNSPRFFNGANRDTTGTYRDTLVNSVGCDSFIYLKLIVKDTSSKIIYDTVCKNSPLFFNGNFRDTSGIYKDTLTNRARCDSFIYLVLLVKDTSSTLLNDSICENQTYFFNNSFRSIAGIYLDTLVNSKGCDSFIYLNLTIKDTSYSIIYDTICLGSTKLFGGKTFDTAGTYFDTLKNINLCDSIIELRLSIFKTDTGYRYDSICQSGDSLYFRFNNLAIIDTGTYWDTLQKRFTGCDSIVRLKLSYFNRDTIKKVDSLCVNGTYSFNGWMIISPGTYYDTLQNKKGCDSVIELRLEYYKADTARPIDSLCVNGTYSFNNMVISSPGIYWDTLQKRITGCDSLIQLRLEYYKADTARPIDSLCVNGTYSFNNMVISSPGIYWDTLQKRITGCDSLIQLRLEYFNVDTTKLIDSLCVHGSYPFNGMSITTPGTYWDTLTSMRTTCDSFIRLRLEFYKVDTSYQFDSICRNGIYSFGNLSLSFPGTYRDTVPDKRTGCDSIIKLVLKLDTGTQTTVVNRDLCRGSSFVFNNDTIRIGGTYKDTLYNRRGCDSFITLIVTMRDSTHAHLSQTICQGDSFKFNDIYQKTPGLYLDTLFNSNQWGCDSFQFMTLTVNPTHRTDQTAYICFGSVYNFYSLLISQAGEYRHTLKNQYLCDSVIVLQLTVSPDTIMDTLRYTGCTSVDFRGINYTAKQTFIDKYKSIQNCDSLWRYHLVIIKPVPKTEALQIIEYCDTITLLGKQYTTSLSIIDTIRTKDTLQCDSLYLPFDIVKYTTPVMSIKANPVRQFYRKGDMVTLEASKTPNYLWNTDSLTKKIYPKLVKDSEVYYVIGWEYDLCKDTAFITLRTSDSTISRFPDAFSPNGDGVNDVFYIKTLGIEKLMILKIYNRLGQLLFSTSSIDEGWDGTYKGVMQDTDVYYYNYQVLTYKGKKETGEGNFMLMR